MKIGIQGGNGSFNHQSLLHYVGKEKITDFEIVFLFTTQNVLNALDAKEIDLGQFAIHNSLGGMVIETLAELGKHQFSVIDHYQIQIAHCMMKKKHVPLEKITTLMAHPQVFKQCHNTLQAKFPQYGQVVGEGEFIDHARVAQGLMNNELGDEIAVMGPKALATIYDLEIVAENLQDSQNSFTTFLMVKRLE